MKAWWFEDGSHRLPHGDRRIIKVGRTHKLKGEIVPCRHGLHGSKRILDALSYAPGNYLWRVELSGEIVSHNDDKHAASERTYLWGMDATEILRRFARMCALDVIHLWDAPDVVIRWLKTGDESLRSASRSAAGSAAGSAAEFAARAAARAAAMSASRSAAEFAAESAAESAAMSAARAAAKARQNRRLTAMAINKRRK